MDVSTVAVILVLCFGGLSMQSPQELQGNVADDNLNVSNFGIKCTTPKGVAGSCAERKFCDHSTYAIDLSLYSTKGYKKPCPENEACCPFGAQMQMNNGVDRNAWDDTFDSDEK